MTANNESRARAVLEAEAKRAGWTELNWDEGSVWPIALRAMLAFATPPNEEVRALQQQLHTYLNHERCRAETLYEGHPSVRQSDLAMISASPALGEERREAVRALAQLLVDQMLRGKAGNSDETIDLIDAALSDSRQTGGNGDGARASRSPMNADMVLVPWRVAHDAFILLGGADDASDIREALSRALLVSPVLGREVICRAIRTFVADQDDSDTNISQLQYLLNREDLLANAILSALDSQEGAG